MNVRELIEFLSTQNPEALVVEHIPVSGGEFVELTATGQTEMVGLKEGRHVRTYMKGRGRIPCVVLDADNSPR